jgi:hypothetical protein
MLVGGPVDGGSYLLTDTDPFSKEARAKLLAILGDEHLTDEVMKIVKKAKRRTERAERAPQWREEGKVFY